MVNPTAPTSDGQPHELVDAPAAAATDADASRLSIYEQLRGRTLLVTGCTGFLGKVFFSLLLYQHPDVKRVYALVRPGKDQSARDRFMQDVALSEPLKPVRERLGEGFLAFLEDKVQVVAGDVSLPMLGIDEAVLAELRTDLDLIINNAGLTDFSPPLDQAVNINTRGARHLGELTRSCEHAALVHTSTCFVTGKRDGEIFEDEELVGFYPRRDDLALHFSAEQEFKDCLQTIEHVKTQATDQERTALFTKQARQALVDDNRNPDSPDSFKAEFAHQKSQWLKRTLREEGKRRAEHWGWTNTYTYSKSMGEQLLFKDFTDLRLAVVRPAVVEGAMEYPTPGWNEGIVTCAPLTYLMYQGVRFVPTMPDVKLDVVPVDFVAQATLAVAAGLLAGKARRIYHVGTSHKNGVSTIRLIELSSLSNRQYYQKRTSEPRWKNVLMTSLDSVPVSRDRWETFSAPGVRKYANGIAALARSVRKSVPGPLGGVLKSVENGASGVAKQSSLVQMVIDVFMPFIYDNKYTFRTDNLATLQAMLPPEEQHLGFHPELIDWRHYWLDVAMPGLHRFVFPLIEERFARPRTTPYTYHDLIELFSASTENHGKRVAMQHITDAGIRRFTYKQLQERSNLAATNLRAAGLPHQGGVLILSENRPEWGMTYFGVLHANGTAVPVDSELSLPEVLNLVRSCSAFAIVCSSRVRKRLEAEGLTDALNRFAEEGRKDDGQDRTAARVVGDLKILSFDAVFAPPAEPVATEALVPATRAWQANDIASLIYTSGTTGRPKGVMLAHRNFTSLLAAVNQVFRISHRDTFLSVLPMHHTFEFTAGFLMPLSRGATITYMNELSSESLQRAFRETNVTAMIGVPALWQLLHRRIVSEVGNRGPYARMVFDTLVSLNRWLRSRWRVNLGRTLFAPVHNKFGGNIRYLISGGASLPGPIMETFQGLGFDLLEGYGLTESAPVLTVNRPNDSLKVGTVGRALPGVEVKIREPDAIGVGEIVARGGNVMLGYWDNPEATRAVVDEDGWLRTGDLGRFDDKGRLYIVGRQKEIIVSSSGENVYPDELEEIFGHHDLIEELSIVGIDDGKGGERVGCMVRAKADVPGKTADEVRVEIRKHLDLKGARLSHPQRIKILRFTDDELPRTATRKIQRRKVGELLAELVQGDAIGEGTVQTTSWGKDAWLRELISGLVDVDDKQLTATAQLVDDLGFDSLGLVDLSAGIQQQTGRELSTDDLLAAGSAGAILELLTKVPHRSGDDEEVEIGTVIPGYSHLPASMRPQGARRGTTRPKTQLGDVIEIPDPVKIGIRAALGEAQKRIYNDAFDVKVVGKANIPWNDNGIVVANHCSHLDMGLVKHALEEWAPNISTLAAADYFFDTTAKRTYFGQLTNLIPMERTGSLDQSMARAVDSLRGGKPLLVFPEGTRSLSGEVAEFRQGLGYLVMASRTGVLPIYLGGTYRALPKGALVPKNRRLKVFIGEYLPFSYFDKATAGMSTKAAYAEASRIVREAVIALKAGRRFLDGPAEAADKGEVDAITELFETLKGRFVQHQVDTRVAFYFSLGNEEHHKWSIVVDPKHCFYHAGKPVGGSADCVVKTTPDVFRKMVKEAYVPSFDEFMSGKIKTSDPALLIAFQSIFGY